MENEPINRQDHEIGCWLEALCVANIGGSFTLTGYVDAINEAIEANPAALEVADDIKRDLVERLESIVHRAHMEEIQFSSAQHMRNYLSKVASTVIEAYTLDQGWTITPAQPDDTFRRRLEGALMVFLDDQVDDATIDRIVQVVIGGGS